MDVKNLIRDSEKVISCISEIGNQLIAKSNCKIYFPKKFEYKQVARIGSGNEALGFVGIVVEDKYYATLSVIAIMPFTPDETNEVEIDDISYYEMVFDKGSIICPNLKVVQQDTLCYKVYDIFFKGCVPWYMDYEDMCNIFSTADEYANASIGNSPEAIALSVSLIARASADKKTYYRQVMEETKEPPYWIQMKSVDFGATSTINKLGGNYFNDGVASSLIDQTDKIEKIEQILRA